MTKGKRFASWLLVLCLPVAHCFLTILLVSKYTRSVRNWTSLFMPRWRFSTTEKYWCTIFATTSSKASTVTSVSFSILTQTASCCRLKSTISKRTRTAKRNCMTQVITPKTARFTAAQTKRTWAIWKTRWHCHICRWIPIDSRRALWLCFGFAGGRTEVGGTTNNSSPGRPRLAPSCK